MRPEAAELAPVPVKRAEAVRHAELPPPEATTPPRVFLSAATEALRDILPWGESGSQFLKSLFIAPNGEFQHITAPAILKHCLDSAPSENSGGLHEGMHRALDRFIACGLIVAERHPIKVTQFFLNPTPGVSELLGLKKEEGIEILRTVVGNFNSADAKEILEARFSYPFREGTTGADVAARLAERSPLSALLKDDSLFEPGATRGYQQRELLGRFLNSAIQCGAIEFVEAKKDQAVHELYSVTDAARPLLAAIDRWK